MRLILTSFVFVVCLAGAAVSQTTVSQQFLDDSTRAFKEVVVLRETVALQTQAIQAVEAEAKAKAEQIELQRTLIESLQREVELKNQQIELFKKLQCDQTSFFWGLIKKKSCN